MDRYLEIRLLPDPEFPPATLLNALFAKLHRGLVEHGAGDIGISFPEAGNGRRTLGQRLRLHGSAAALEQLMQLNWLQGMRDHVEVGEHRATPKDAAHRVVRRIQAKSNPERLRRRLLKRNPGMDTQTAAQRIPDSAAAQLNLPFIALASSSSRQRFPLFIEHGPLQNEATSGPFSAYGLSPTTTIPWF
jgi:CRISPR-associated endonuclease Csy4